MPADTRSRPSTLSLTVLAAMLLLQALRDVGS